MPNDTLERRAQEEMQTTTAKNTKGTGVGRRRKVE
jgi:hypothetical protein